MKLISVYDKVAQAHLNLATVRTSGEGIRQFEQECQNPQSPFYKNPNDFILKEVADYDELTATITPHEKHIILAIASDFKQS